MRLPTLLSVLLFSLYLTNPAKADDQLRILVMGDSFMTSNASQRGAVPHLLGKVLGAQVKSRAVTGARYVYALPITGALGMNISKQWRKGNWDWVVMNGGGNDIWMGCGCGKCTKRLNRLLSPDGSDGIIATSVARARESGARVIYADICAAPALAPRSRHAKQRAMYWNGGSPKWQRVTAASALFPWRIWCHLANAAFLRWI